MKIRPIKFAFAVLGLTLANTLLYLVIFTSALLILSDFYAWHKSFSRGLVWQFYSVAFVMLSLALNLLLLAFRIRELSHRLAIVSAGYLLLIIYFFDVGSSYPYSMLLAHITGFSSLSATQIYVWYVNRDEWPKQESPQ